MTVRLTASFLKYSVLRIFPSCYSSSGASISNYRETNHNRKYSQKIASVVKEKPPISKNKVRTRRKPAFVKPAAEANFWNVIAVATAEEYDLELMFKALLANKNYRPSNFFETINAEGMDLDFLHMVAKCEVEKENRELFIFRQGSFAGWNLSDFDVQNLRAFVRDYEINSYKESVIQSEIEVMPYTYTANNKTSLLRNGNICLTPHEDKNSLDKYTCSNGMVSSVKLGVWESLLDQFVEMIEPITMDLKQGNRINVSRKDLLKKTGELYALKHKINLSSDLLDVPDFYWEREELESLYLTTYHYFSIPKRTKVINDKIHHCMELLDLLSSHLSDRHHVRLELMIIGLIMVEVAFECVHYMQRFARVEQSEILQPGSISELPSNTVQ